MQALGGKEAADSRLSGQLGVGPGVNTNNTLTHRTHIGSRSLRVSDVADEGLQLIRYICHPSVATSSANSIACSIVRVRPSAQAAAKAASPMCSRTAAKCCSYSGHSWGVIGKWVLSRNASAAPNNRA